MTGETLYHNSSDHMIITFEPFMLQHSLRSPSVQNFEIGRAAIVVIRPSALRLGLGARLAGAACLVSAIWILIGWVLWQ